MNGTSYGALLDAVRGVHWPARAAVSGGIAGAHLSRQRGTSAEFTEYRLYRQGDDPRRLDWRLLARSDRAYLRLATDRALLPTMLVVDASASMDFPHAARGTSKWRRARELAIGLAAVAQAEGDPVGVVVVGPSAPRALPPRSRRGVVGDIARVVDEVSPFGSDPIAPALLPLRVGRIVIITDLLGDAGELLRAARVHAVAGRDVQLVHVIAREELDPPRRPFLASDPERPGLQRLLIESERRRYLDAFGEWRAEMARAWRAANAVYVEVVTDEEASHAVRRVVGAAHRGAAR